jgi:hypothetical protein
MNSDPSPQIELDSANLADQNFSLSQTSNDVPTNLETESHIRTEITEIQTQSQIFPEDKLCTPCLEQNLIECGIADTFKTCPTCGELFCSHAVSRIDPQYCVYCCNDFQLSSTDQTVIREVRNEDGKITSAKSFRVRHLGLSGQHWLFYNRAITSLSDLELDCAIEYHFGIRNGMIQEREARRTARAHRNQGKVAGNEEKSLIEGSAADPIIITPGGARIALSSSSSRKARTVKNGGASSKGDVNAGEMAAKALKILLASGLSEEQILGLGKK